MDLFDSSGKKFRVQQKNYLAEGGEARLYAVKDKVIKLYFNKDLVVPIRKMEELQNLDHPSVIKPIDSVFDIDGERLGYMMKRAPASIALPRLISSAYWNDNALTSLGIGQLIDQMRMVIKHIHSNGFLQVDGNEFNYLVCNDHKTPYFIDVDSYQTPGFPASVIMPSIRDFTQDNFDEGSDWFSFAVVTFQMFTGIHPYKGRHPDFRPGDIEGRVKAGLSVLNNSVRIPGSARSFNIIPKDYRVWYQALFENGERCPPPALGQIKPVIVSRRIIQDGKRITIKLISDYKKTLRKVYYVHGQRIAHTDHRLFIGMRSLEIPKNTYGILITKDNQAVFLSITQNNLFVQAEGQAKPIDTGILARQLLISHNTAYIFNDSQIVELKLNTLTALSPSGTNRTLLSPVSSRAIMSNASMIFDGLVVQNIMGKTHLMIPVQSGMMPIIATPQLDAYRLIDARYENGVVMASLANRDGEYFQARMRFNSTFDDFDFELHEDAERDLNFTVLEHRLQICIPREGLLEVVPSQPREQRVRRVKDSQVQTTMRLVNLSGLAGFYSGTELFQIQLRD